MRYYFTFFHLSHDNRARSYDVEAVALGATGDDHLEGEKAEEEQNTLHQY